MVGGPFVGLFPGIAFEANQARLERGDRLFMYTDGIPEATDRDMNLFGESRMIECIGRNGGNESLEYLIKSLLDEIDRFVGSSAQADDLTMLVLKYSG
jgi:sigma-B regulation protein RsbU (phosphoserine phosphatase)